MANKEWKGNSKSVSSMLGMSTTWHPEQRASGDYYTTDPDAVRALLHKGMSGVFDFWKQEDYTIYKCACGSGNISKVLEENGYNVLSTDLVDRGYGTAGIDFLKVQKLPKKCVILTNPPYKYANEFILHALDLLPEGGNAIFFLNINYLAGLKRYRTIYKQMCLRWVLIFSNRTNCYKNNKPSGYSSPVNYGWFVFEKGYDELPVISWLSTKE